MNNWSKNSRQNVALPPPKIAPPEDLGRRLTHARTPVNKRHIKMPPSSGEFYHASPLSTTISAELLNRRSVYGIRSMQERWLHSKSPLITGMSPTYWQLTFYLLQNIGMLAAVEVEMPNTIDCSKLVNNEVLNKTSLCWAVIPRLSTLRYPHLLVSTGDCSRYRSIAGTLPAGRSAANKPHAAEAIDRWNIDGRTDTRSLHRSCSAYYAGSINDKFQIPKLK